MLWYKGWLEMRWRILFTLVMTAFPVFLFVAITAGHIPAPKEDGLTAVKRLVDFWALYFMMLPTTLLSGSGVTIRRLSERKGVQGSMYFTLSLPISRFRLLATRAGLGFLAFAGILAIAPCTVWVTCPPLRPLVTGRDWLAYWVTLVVCSSAFYLIGVLFSTFVDETVRVFLTFFGVVALYAILFIAPFPAPVNIFRAMGDASPFFTHSFPWASMGIAVGAAGILFLTSLRVLQTHDY